MAQPPITPPARKPARATTSARPFPTARIANAPLDSSPAAAPFWPSTRQGQERRLRLQPRRCRVTLPDRPNPSPDPPLQYRLSTRLTTTSHARRRSMPTQKERIEGGLVGLLVGGALAGPYEFSP